MLLTRRGSTRLEALQAFAQNADLGRAEEGCRPAPLRYRRAPRRLRVTSGIASQCVRATALKFPTARRSPAHEPQAPAQAKRAVDRRRSSAWSGAAR